MSISKPKAKVPSGATIKYQPAAVVKPATSSPQGDKPASNIHK